MSAQGTMVYQWYLKKALRIAANQYLCETGSEVGLKHAPEAEIQKQVDLWMIEARKPDPKASRRANQVPTPKSAPNKISRPIDALDAEAERNETHNKMVEDSGGPPRVRGRVR